MIARTVGNGKETWPPAVPRRIPGDGDLPWVMFPKGMPLKTTFLTGTYMYYQTMETKNVDYGAALAVLIVVLGVVLAKIVNAIFKEKDY